jgi:hypothetical protein
MVDPYVAGKMVEHTQGELARSRGVRNWKRLFNNHTAKMRR